MINKLACFSVIIATLFSAVHKQQEYSTLSVVTIVGSVVSSDNQEIIEKYKRKDCPVCNGKGWYLSGDGIAKIECQYCEP